MNSIIFSTFFHHNYINFECIFTTEQVANYPPRHTMAEFARLVYITAYLKTHFPTKFAQVALWVAASEDY